jgi:hypothetical protein
VAKSTSEPPSDAGTDDEPSGVKPVTSANSEPNGTTTTITPPASSDPAPSVPTAKPSEPEAEPLAPTTNPTASPTADPPVRTDAGTPGEEPTDEAGSPEDPLATSEPGPSDAAAPEEPEGWSLDGMDDPIENPEICPDAEPVEGDACTFGSVCKYGAEPDCRSRWVCASDDRWFLEYAQRDCPGLCPDVEPLEGDACTGDRVQCTFGPTPTCRSHWLCYEQRWALLSPADDCETQEYCPEAPPAAGETCEPEMMGERCTYETGERCGCTCYWDEAATAAGAAKVEWFCGTISAGYPPSYLTACPTEVPAPGGSCDHTTTCGYVTQDECSAFGAGTTLATCVDGAWSIQEPTTSAGMSMP